MENTVLVKFLVKRNVRFRVTSILLWRVGHKRVVRTQRMSRNQFFFSLRILLETVAAAGRPLDETFFDIIILLHALQCGDIMAFRSWVRRVRI